MASDRAGRTDRRVAVGSGGAHPRPRAAGLRREGLACPVGARHAHARCAARGRRRPRMGDLHQRPTAGICTARTSTSRAASSDSSPSTCPAPKTSSLARPNPGGALALHQQGFRRQAAFGVVCRASFTRRALTPDTSAAPGRQRLSWVIGRRLQRGRACMEPHCGPGVPGYLQDANLTRRHPHGAMKATFGMPTDGPGATPSRGVELGLTLAAHVLARHLESPGNAS